MIFWKKLWKTVDSSFFFWYSGNAPEEKYLKNFELCVIETIKNFKKVKFSIDFDLKLCYSISCLWKKDWCSLKTEQNVDFE